HGIEAADVEVADRPALEARMVDVDEGGRGEAAYVGEDAGGRPLGDGDGAAADLRLVGGQREGAGVAPVLGGDLVALGAADAIGDAELGDDGRVVGDDVVIGGDDEVDAVADELVDAVAERDARVERRRRVDVEVGGDPAARVDDVAELHGELAVGAGGDGDALLARVGLGTVADVDAVGAGRDADAGVAAQHEGAIEGGDRALLLAADVDHGELGRRGVAVAAEGQPGGERLAAVLGGGGPEE